MVIGKTCKVAISNKVWAKISDDVWFSVKNNTESGRFSFLWDTIWVDIRMYVDNIIESVY